MNTQKIETWLKSLISGKSWKQAGIVTLILIGVLVALNSVLFVLVLGLIKLVLLLAIVGMAVRTGMLVYPELEQKVKDMQK